MEKLKHLVVRVLAHRFVFGALLLVVEIRCKVYDLSLKILKLELFEDLKYLSSLFVSKYEIFKDWNFLDLDLLHLLAPPFIVSLSIL